MMRIIMESSIMQNEYLKQEFQEEFQKKLKGQFRKRRKELGLTQLNVANTLDVSLDTYQRWEKPGSQYLTNIFSILSVFKALDFSIVEIIDMLSLPPLTSSGLEAVCQDEDTLKSIKENGIRLTMRNSYCRVGDFTLGEMLSDLLKEYLERLESRNKNP